MTSAAATTRSISTHFDRLVSVLSKYHFSTSSSSESDRDMNDSSSSSDSEESNTLSVPETVQPSAWVLFPLASLDVILDRVFDIHATNGTLGLILSAKSNDNDWTKATVNIDGVEHEYFVSNSKRPSLDATTTTAPAFPFAQAGLRSVISFTSSDAMNVYVVERPRLVFPETTPSLSLASSPSLTPHNNIPTLAEWNNLWKAWDLVTLEMIPREMLLQKPIDLRHKCLFYIGHIPTFLDMLLSKAIGGEPTEPKYFWDIFERGIDPHVDDPDHCHNHSAVPTCDSDWPSLETIIQFKDGVRARLARLYADLDSGKVTLTRRIARMLVMCIEHEGWHVETLLYMLIQRSTTFPNLLSLPSTLPPPGFQSPLWDVLAEQWEAVPPPVSATVELGGEGKEGEVVLGHVDSEGDDKDFASKDSLPQILSHTYGWDNESPSQIVNVGKFKAEWRPISNGEFWRYWSEGKGTVPTPSSWVVDDKTGEVKVRTLYGSVPLSIARTWPVLASYDSLLAYAKSKGGRLPTEGELRLFLDKYNVASEKEGGNTGFRNWHCVAPTAGIDGTPGTNGGIWEWTCTHFSSYPGMVPTNLFTGYSEDFFDGVHMVVLGASYATIPRLALRHSVRNFWQHNYPYAWVGGRVVYDV